MGLAHGIVRFLVIVKPFGDVRYVTQGFELGNS